VALFYDIRLRGSGLHCKINVRIPEVLALSFVADLKLLLKKPVEI
jgi:hypothetical protein